jgi:hypothetical protein
VEEFLPHWKASVFDLSAIKESDIPSDSDAPVFHAVLRALKSSFSDDPLEKGKDILSELHETLGKETVRYKDIASLIYFYLTSCSKEKTEDKLMPIQKELAAFLDEDEEDMPEGFKILRKWNAAKAKGKAEAFSVMRKTVLATVKTKFGKVPAGFKRMIGGCADMDVLSDWVIRAAISNSIDEFYTAKKS